MDKASKPLLRGAPHVKYSPLETNSTDSDIDSIPMTSMGASNARKSSDDELPKVASTRPSRYNKKSSNFCFRCLGFLKNLCFPKKELQPRTVLIGECSKTERYPPNVICNQKYNVVTFIPGVLYNQFKFFLNLYFLAMACSQFVPALKVGYLYTYWAPLGFVLSITMLREAIDEIRRYYRDKEINSALYKKLNPDGKIIKIKSSNIQVSDVLVIEKDQRIPADLILLKTSDKPGSCFIRTDQLDGETDWKLKLAIHATQALQDDATLFLQNAKISAEKPHNDIHSFTGSFTMKGKEKDSVIQEPLGIENALWANTVLASGSVVAAVLHTGKHTRSVMNTSNPETKVGLVDEEINFLTKILFALVILLAFALIAVKGFDGPWYRYMFRFIILFSYIIPIGLRVNLDLGKIVYSWFIQRDKLIPGTVVRSSTIPEELGRVNYLLSDKTGTLTQNEMIFRRLHIGTVAYSLDSMDEIVSELKVSFSEVKESPTTESDLPKNFFRQQEAGGTKVKLKSYSKTSEAVKALALCHNVTPVYESDNTDAVGSKVYQASSPDEIALVKWTESVGLTLSSRDLSSITLQSPSGSMLKFTILQIFPFTSESKRMGIIVRDDGSDQIIFYLKGADMVMKSIVQFNDWMEEECGNMAREGLRTLVVAKKHLSEEVYQDFDRQHMQAKLTMVDRASRVNSVVELLESDMELLCVTGVEDKLQRDVRPTLEMLGHAGIKVWMLTGDKLETAICIAKSSRLVSRDQTIHVFSQINSRNGAHLELNSFRRRAPDTALVIDGASLESCLRYYAVEFVELACQCPAVVLCRCSPTQKAAIVTLLQSHTSKRICAIGDGGNDVSMIQAANCGIGIVGKEGRQASLAADFSITQFCHLGSLLMVHGRNSYKRSASLSQFIIHRGLIISIMQAVFSSVFYFSSVSLYQGFLMVGYPTIFTMFPVFSLVLDQDVSARIALRFPELYRELHKGRSLSLKTFLLWVLISTYQGGAIMYGALLLFDSDFTHAVSISFTSLIITELVMVALTIRTWHWLMGASQAFSVATYVIALVVLKEYFDPVFLVTVGFLWRVLVISSFSCLPLVIVKYLRKRLSPPSYAKLGED